MNEFGFPAWAAQVLGPKATQILSPPASILLQRQYESHVREALEAADPAKEVVPVIAAHVQKQIGRPKGSKNKAKP